jgi:hypothetical protein
MSAMVGIVGDTYQAGGATTTVIISSASATQGGCLQLLHPQTQQYWRLYIGSKAQGAATVDGLVVELGECK